MATGAVTSRVILDSTITAADIAPGTLHLASFDDAPGATYAAGRSPQSLSVSALLCSAASIDVPADGYVLAVGSGQGCIESLVPGSRGRPLVLRRTLIPSRG